jgi:hypothetical protein
LAHEARHPEDTAFFETKAAFQVSIKKSKDARLRRGGDINMNTRWTITILGLSAVGRLSLPRTANTDRPPSSSPNRHCCTKQPATAPLNPKKLARHSAPFRKAAEEAWRALRNGDAPFEAGFSIDRGGQPGKVQLSLFSTTKAATHLSLASNKSALGTLHVHDKFGELTPSAADIKSAQMLHKTVFVESRTGLYSIDPGGNVRLLFNEMDWFSKKCPN